MGTLVRMLGSARFELAEESVQDAFIKALQIWPFSGIPVNPAAWLTTVAKNRALDVVRRQALWRSKEDAVIAETASSMAEPNPILGDEQLELMFLCCHPE